jgi:hypothetical protein
MGDFDAFSHEVASPVEGRWEFPEYLVRRPLDYMEFVRVVKAAAAEGVDLASIAKGVGVRENDVVMGLVLGDRL